VQVLAEAGSEIAVDGQPAGTAPLHRTVPVDPGNHQLTARAPGAAIGHVGSVTVVAGQTVEWEAKAAPEPLADAPMTPNLSPRLSARPESPPSITEAPAAREPTRRRWLPWAIGGAAVVAGAVVTAIVLSGGGKDPKGTAGVWDRR